MRVLLEESGVSAKYWEYAAYHVAYVKNRLHNKALVVYYDIVCVRYVSSVPCSPLVSSELVSLVRSEGLGDRVYITPNYKEKNLMTVVFVSVSLLNRLLKLPERALRNAYVHGAVMQDEAVLVVAGTIVRTYFAILST